MFDVVVFEINVSSVGDLHNNRKFEIFSLFKTHFQKIKCYSCVLKGVEFILNVRELREKEKNILVLSSGEFFYGSSHHTLHGWKLAGHLLSKLKLDAMSLSNHDFGRGVLELSAFLYKLNFPVLCANMEATKSSFLHSRINKSIVLNVNNEKIAIIGYLHPHAIKKSRPAVSVKLLPEIPIIQEEVQKLQNEGVNKVIALGHSGYYTDLKIAKQVKGVDVVIGGDSDIILEKTDVQGGEDMKYPGVTQHDMNKTLVLHVPQHGKYIGVLRITFDEIGNVIAEHGERVLLDSNVPQNQEVLLLLKNASQVLEQLAEDYRIPDRDEVLATAEATLDGKSRSCRLNECSLGNFVADAFLYMLNKHRNESSGIDAVVINSGLIRCSIQAGNVTARDLTHALFLGDLLEEVRMNGSGLRDMLEHSVMEYDTTGITASGAFLQVSGEDDVTLLIDYMREMKSIKPKIDKRISFYYKDIPMPALKEYPVAKNATDNSSLHDPDGDSSARKVPHTVVSTLYGEHLTSIDGFELFKMISPFLTDFERSFLESVISGKEQPFSSIDALEDHLKVGVRLFLKVETISVGSPDDIIPTYSEGLGKVLGFNKTEENRKAVFLNMAEFSDEKSIRNGTNGGPEKLADEKDAQSMHELLLYSIVQSIMDKIKENMGKFGVV